MSGKEDQGGAGKKLAAENEQLREAAQKTAAGIAALGDCLAKLGLASPEEIAMEDFDVFDATSSALSMSVAERNSLKRSLAAQKGVTKRSKAALVALEEVTKPRSLGPLNDQLKPAELYELLVEADHVEIAFCDGSKELLGVSPVAVPGSAFGFRRGRLFLRVADLQLRGPADERGARILAGYALLIDGEQVAWAPRIAGQLTLGPGVAHQLKDDVTIT